MEKGGKQRKKLLITYFTHLRGGYVQKKSKRKKDKKNPPRSSQDNSSDSLSDASEDQGGIKTVSIEREEWMSMPAMKAEAHTVKDGAPAEKTEPTAPSPYPIEPAVPAVKTVVGDGGASWRMKALHRAQEQSRIEGSSLAELVTDRWGSLHALTAGITERRPAHAKAHLHSAKDRKGDRAEDSSSRHHYLRDVKTSRGQMVRPRETDAFDWFTNKKKKEEEGITSSLLQKAAPEMNAFSNDGSFMQQFSLDREDMSVARDREQPSEEKRGEIQVPLREGGGGGDSEQHLIVEKGDNCSVAELLRARLQGKIVPTAHTVTLPLLDPQGRPVPGAFGRESAVASRAVAARPTRHNAFDPGGQRKRYFADDDRTDLDALVKRTKYGSTGDMDNQMAKGIAKNQRYKLTEFDADAEYDHDAGVSLLEGKSLKQKKKEYQDAQVAIQKEKHRQVKQHRQHTNALEKCNLCFSSSARPKHLTIALGEATYLALPSKGRLVPGHVQIIPAEHVPSSRQVDDSVWTEIRNFKKCLLQMHAAGGRSCVFYETALGVSDMKAHAVIDCVPVPSSVISRGPLVFKKAIDDATYEWSQHHAKRFLDIKSKGLRGCIPPHFPYMVVEFGLSEGFVHVIDDEKSFKRDLARSVVVGLLKLPEEEMHRHARQESEGMQCRWAAEFRKQFDDYDWTKMLS